MRQLADALEAAVADPPDAIVRTQRISEACHRFAMNDPHAYRIMFDIDAPSTAAIPISASQASRAANYITQQAEQLADAGSMSGPTHGLVMLRQAGLLEHAPAAGPWRTFTVRCCC